MMDEFSFDDTTHQEGRHRDKKNELAEGSTNALEEAKRENKAAAIRLEPSEEL